MNLILQSVGLGIVIKKGFDAQAAAKANGETASRPSRRHVLGVVAISIWAILGLIVLLTGGILKPIHTYIALELGTVLPILS